MCAVFYFSFSGYLDIIVETRTGNGVLERVKDILEEKKKHPVNFEARIDMAMETTEETKRTIESVPEDLSGEERKAFKSF